MTATDTTASTLLVAIDISKHLHEVLIGIPGKKRRRRLTILNMRDDFQRLVTILADYGLPVRIGSRRRATTIDRWRIISAKAGSPNQSQTDHCNQARSVYIHTRSGFPGG